MKLKPIQDEPHYGWLIYVALGLSLSFFFGRFIEGHIQMQRKMEFCSWLSKDDNFTATNYWELKRRCGKYDIGKTG